MKQKLLFFPLALMILFSRACEKNPDIPIISTMPPTEQPALGGIMRETAPLTEPETEKETVPSLQTAEPWVSYGGLREKEFPEAEHITAGFNNLEKINCMVGGIEQRFYENQPVSEENIQAVSEAWKQFSGEALNLKNLTCIMPDKKMSFPSVPEEEYQNIQSLEYVSGDMLLHYETESQSLNLSRKEFPQNPESVYKQASPLWQTAMKVIYDEENNSSAFVRDTSVLHAGWEDTVILDGEEVTLFELQNTARNFLYSHETGTSLFFTSDYQLSDEKLEIQNFPDGSQAVIFRFGFESRDIPIVSEIGTESGGTKKIEGTSIEIGLFRKDEIGYIKANYFINQPSQMQLTDPRPKMPGITLIDMNAAVQSADNFLTEERTLKSGKLQYATEKIFDSRGIFQGYVLTPVWHFVFHPTEEELQQGYCSMILDIDAVTSDVLQWYTTESEQSGEKCWTTHTENE